jgi:hypothetical protein
MNRKKPRATPARRKVEEGIKKVREFHRIGRESSKTCARHTDDGWARITTDAEKRGMNPDTLRKAQRFADLYDAGAIKKLLAQCKVSDYVIGPTHIIELLRVPIPKERRHFQTKMIAEGWTRSQLAQQIMSRYGARRVGGRSPRVPRDKAQLLSQIEGMCEHWRRWHKKLMAGNAEEAVADAPGSLLPRSVRQLVEKAVAQIAVLQQRASRELTIDRPSRLPRAVAREE